MYIEFELAQRLRDIERVNSGWHKVTNDKRYKLLAERGEYIYWSQYFGCYIWDFENRKTR